ncbi:hypothetical protein J2S43_005749 [Catenuloplanes nepalensis]|uniref:Bacterial Ig-like domain-containing protein n=1 Tax=Catenuloplanes nepalensis TaxID=587533 RepID=A0ABT9N0M1_9ACTN|nr:Ig-like domain repeat protein [Catenuloplanes nepalensis]MDP9797237.1 hypothetical protein [Catenuloplanes nepalensis]
MNLSKRAIMVATAATALLVGAPTAALAAPAGTVGLSPLSGKWQFGTGNPSDSVTLTAPAAACPAGSTYYINALTAAGREADVVTAGAPLAPLVTLGADLAIPAQSGTFTGGSTQLLVNSILPAGTSDLELSPADAAKPVGTVLATAPFSVVGACVDSSFAVTTYAATSVDISAATRAPKPADWPANTFYDALQWSWDARSATTVDAHVYPTRVKRDQAVWAVVDTSATRGKVQVLDGTKVVATADLCEGYALVRIPPLTTKGQHTLTVVFTGSDTHRPATSAPITVTVI